MARPAGRNEPPVLLVKWCDAAESVAVVAFGNAYISGQTEGNLGRPSAGGTDVFLIKYEVPEPATLGMLALGGLAVIRTRRRRLETTKLASENA